jgi:hypothetical protein
LELATTGFAFTIVGYTPATYTSAFGGTLAILDF